MPAPEAPLLLGLDVGGTGSRGVVTDPAGRRLGSARDAGGNPQSRGGEVAAARIGGVLRAALGGLDPAGAAVCVIGLAGYRRFATEAARAEFVRHCRAAAGPAAPDTLRILLRPDAEVAFAAGTGAPDGVVLVAGTGSVACRIDRRRVTATRGGLGWLLGDEGSGAWLGREAARHTARALEEDTPDGLCAEVLAELGLPAGRPAEALSGLLRAVYDAPSTAPARLAPLVGRAAAAGDPAASRIVARAAAHLAALVRAALPAGGPSGPVVLAGAVAASPGPVRDALTADLLSGPSALGAAAATGDTAMAAAWLAALELDPTAPREAFLPEP